MSMRVVNIVGTRPNSVKMSALPAAQTARADAFSPMLIHTGQHRDPAMSERLFADPELPAPNVMLCGTGGGQVEQIGSMLTEIDRALRELMPNENEQPAEADKELIDPRWSAPSSRATSPRSSRTPTLRDPWCCPSCGPSSGQHPIPGGS